MTEQTLDELMKNVLLDSIRLDKEITFSSNLSFAPSPAYREQIRRMLSDPNGWVKRIGTPLWKQLARHAATILLVLSITLGSMMALSTEVRATVLRWIRDQFQGTIFYEYFGEDVSDQIPRFSLGKLPEGYEEVERIGDSAFESVTYQNDEMDTIYFDYYYVQEGGASVIVPGDDVIIEIMINGMEGEIYIPQNPENKKVIRWIDTRENIHYFITAAVEENILLEMAENIFEKN
ncbi:MAG: DUF4367 domain-containing protein [Firmicutes bacterium]|nr:DUF4367 domain-containing protein [Bacillota bacterium]